MIPFSFAFLRILMATLIPTYAGLFAVGSAVGRSLQARYLSAFSVGVFLWYFSDTIGDSSYLGVNEGLSGGVGHLGLPLLLVAGLVFFLAIDKSGMVSNAEPESGKAISAPSLLIALLVTIALSVHGFGEGAGFGATASSTVSLSIISAFGGYGPTLSYIFHKALEAIMLGTGYVIYSASRGGGSGTLYSDIFVLGFIFTIPTIIGTAISYYLPFDTTYVFAVATGTSVYVILKLAAPLFMQGNRSSYFESLKLGSIILFGFLLLYTAALFHSVTVF